MNILVTRHLMDYKVKVRVKSRTSSIETANLKILMNL
jgi:hypothetical protein